MSKKILICDSCKRQFKTEQGYGRHIETYPDHEICFNNQNNTSTTFCSDSNEINNNNQTQKKIKSNDNKKIYKVDSHNNDKFQPTWNTYKIDSHLHPVHENIKDKDLSFIHNVIINSIQNQKLVILKYLKIRQNNLSILVMIKMIYIIHQKKILNIQQTI